MTKDLTQEILQRLDALALERVRHGMGRVRVCGDPTGRLDIIEESVKILQAGGDRLRSEYLGIKNYANFGDQREDHPYGCGPRHGSIVFKVVMSDARRMNKDPLTSDEVGDAIYYLLAERDFTPIREAAVENGHRVTRTYNLGDCIERMDRALAEVEKWAAHVAKAKPAPEAAALRSILP